MSIGSIYCRVSTEDQKIHGLSLPFQREACLKFAQEHNLEVSDDAIFLEQYSGGEYERPLLSQLLSRVRKGEISFVIFTKRDRVARDQFVFQKIKREVENTGAKIYFAEEKLTGNVAIDGFMGSTLVGFSEYEREIIKTRTQSGKIQAARQNRWAFSSIPFGYVKNLQTKELEIYEDEAKIIKYIFNTYLNGGISIEGLSKHLTDANIPPPSLSTKGTGIQKGVLGNRKNAIYKWIPSTVARIFDKVELYSGTYTAFKNVYKKIGGKTVYMGERPKEEWINVSVPPIISKEEAEEIEDKMAFNKRFADKGKRIYLLKGKLLCDCKSELHSMLGNSRMKRKTRKDGSVYEYEKTEYRCSLRTKARVDDDRRCKNAILSRKVEGVIIDTIKELFITPEMLFDYESVKYPGKNKTEGDNPNRYLELKETLEKMVSKIERSEELFIDGLITKDRLRDMKKTLDIKKEDLRKSIIKEEKYLHREAFMNSMIESWEDMRKEFYEIIEEFFDIATPEQIREIIDIFVDQIIISPNKTKSLTIRLKIPFDIALSNKYYEDEKITWTDDHGKEHIIMTIDELVPKKLSLGDLHDPIVSKEVVFDTQKKKDKDEDDDKTGKGGGGSGAITGAIEKMIEFVERVKYKVSLESHHCFICKDFTSETGKFTEHKAKITPRNWSYFYYISFTIFFRCQSTEIFDLYAYRTISNLLHKIVKFLYFLISPYMHLEKHYTVEQVLDAIGLLKQEKGVDTILNLVKEKIFSNDLNTENVEEFKKFVRKFTSLYYLMKDKFSEVERTSGERYFEHLREVVNNILKLPNPNTKKVLIAIAHDSIEDTNKTFEGLGEDYGYDVALAVQAISKEPWRKYQDLSIENEEERIRNAKKQRNITYFGHLQSFETFKSHITNLAKEKGIELTEEKLIEITRNSLDVKFADRIHNLSTQWDPSNLEQVRKKTDETKRFFLGIAQETNNEAYEQIKTLLLTLELRLQDTSGKITALLGG